MMIAIVHITTMMMVHSTGSDLLALVLCSEAERPLAMGVIINHFEYNCVLRFIIMSHLLLHTFHKSRSRSAVVAGIFCRCRNFGEIINKSA